MTVTSSRPGDSSKPGDPSKTSKVTLAKATTGVAVGTISETCNAPAAAPWSEYWAGADPVTPNGTGTRYFATDTRGTIFASTAAAIANPIPTTATPVQ